MLLAFLSHSPVYAQTNSKTDSLHNEPDYGLLGSRICFLYVSARNLTGMVKKAIYDFIKEEENIANPSPADILRLLNKHKNDLTCAGKNAISTSFEHGKYNEILLDLFTGDLYTEDVKFDFNAITYTKNPTTGVVEPMTILDYIEKVALKERSMSGSSESKAEINGIKDLLIEEFSAKRFNELTPDAVAEWQAQLKP